MPNLKHMLSKLFPGKLFVDADPGDGSITLSPALLALLNLDDEPCALAFVARVGKLYAFTINPGYNRTDGTLMYGAIRIPEALDGLTVLAPIMRNLTLGCVGFVPQYPPLARILYEYGITGNGIARLPVEHQSIDGEDFYLFLQPE